MLKEDYKLHLLWEKIEEHFAKNEDVKKLAKEMRALENGTEVAISKVSHTAAGIVLKALRQDVDNLKRFTVEIVPYLDKNGYPGVKEVSFNKIYLTPSPGGQKNYEWDKWIAIPNASKIPGCKPWVWERLGLEKADLSWVTTDLTKMNKELERMGKQIKSYSKALGMAMLNKAVKPLNELKAFVSSDVYMKFIYEKMPRASLTQDGLMTSGSYALLNALSVWASHDHKQIGGGALGADYVLEQFKREGILAEHKLKNKK